jgi:hypothetical protein
VLVAAPVSPAGAQQLDGVGLDVARAGHVGAATEVNEVALAIDADLGRRFGRRVAHLVHLARRQVTDQLDLVGLGGEEGQRLVHRQGRVLELRVLAQ